MSLEELITVEKNDKGNIIFSYSPIKYKETSFKRVIIPQSLFVLASIIVCFIIHKQIEQISPTVILIGFLILFLIFSSILVYRWSLYTERLNSQKEIMIINNALVGIIKQDIASFGSNIIELERKLYIKTEGYGEIKEKYLAIILSNGIQLKYSIDYISYFEKKLVQVINVQYEKI